MARLITRTGSAASGLASPRLDCGEEVKPEPGIVLAAATDVSPKGRRQRLAAGQAPGGRVVHPVQARLPVK
jgi:hypothetical protein